MNQQKKCLWFVLHFLSNEQKQVRLACTREFVETADRNPNFLKSIVMRDRCLCYMYNPQTKRQSAAWLSLGASRPAKFRQWKSKVKTLLIIFFHAKGLLPVPQMGPLEFVAWQYTGTHHNCVCLIFPPPTPTLAGFDSGQLFCFPKPSCRWKARFSRIFWPSKVLGPWSWRQSHKLSSAEYLMEFISAAKSVYIEKSSM